MSECATISLKESVLWEALEHYGVKAQMLKAIEECGELIVAIAKNDLPNIAEEVADVGSCWIRSRLRWALIQERFGRASWRGSVKGFERRR